jgi:hypothetical protein
VPFEIKEDKQKPIQTKILRKAFESLQPLDERMVIEGFISDLENYGIVISSPDEAYSLLQIEDAMTKYLERTSPICLWNN